MPADWGQGWDNVSVVCTVENQRRADERLPVFMAAPIRHKSVACEPLLTDIDLSRWLGPELYLLLAGGESGQRARPCRWEWVLHLREQAMGARVPFYFKQTGAVFVKDGVTYRVPRKLQHSQAKKAGINVYNYLPKY